MGKRGPKPTPSGILKLRGSWRGDRPGEPQPEITRPDCPKYFNNRHRETWDELCGQLVGMNVLTQIDGSMLSRYVVMLCRWEDLHEFPESKECMRLNTALKQIETEFGMSPAARTRIKIEKEEKQEDPLSRYGLGGA